MDTNLQSTTIKGTITFVEEVDGEAFFCVSLIPSHLESGTYTSASFGLSLDECIERYRGDFLADVTSSLVSAQIEFLFLGD